MYSGIRSQTSARCLHIFHLEAHLTDGLFFLLWIRERAKTISGPRVRIHHSHDTERARLTRKSSIKALYMFRTLSKDDLSLLHCMNAPKRNTFHPE